MKYYIDIKAQPNGDYEIHTKECTHLPIHKNIKYLGEFPNCKEALREAKKYYTEANGCYYCSSDCHEENFDI
ncbi:MAG: hypothetical protein WCX30_02435 [Candidatus Paceibacterota bacterium]|jgi:hypothetical protein|nr:hypothetical protein [bacterium]